MEGVDSRDDLPVPAAKATLPETDNTAPRLSGISTGSRADAPAHATISRVLEDKIPYRDDGQMSPYSKEYETLASNLPTLALESYYREAVSRHGHKQRVPGATRFAGGVLASRADSSITVEDVFEFIETGTGSVDINRVKRDAQRTFGLLKEGVAGRVAVEVLAFVEMELDLLVYGRYAPGYVFIDREVDIWEGTVAHEIGHGVLAAHGVAPSDDLVNRGEPVDEWLFEFDIWTDGDDAAREFREEVLSLGERLRQGEAGEDTDGIVEAFRGYQTENAEELFAVAFGAYCTAKDDLEEKQPAMVQFLGKRLFDR